MSPRYGTNATAATHDTSSAIVTTWNSERVYSPVLEAAVAIGKNPAAAISVPVSIGNAVLSQANAAARMRSKPCSILIAIISTEMIASSTSRPSDNTSAPSEILCRPTPNSCMPANVIASTSGIDSATTSPVRQPSEKKLTNSTIATASLSTRTNSPTDSLTAAGWSETLRSSIPAGSVFCNAENLCSSALPSVRMSPPARIATPMPIASSPMKRMRGPGGSAKPRRTWATSPRRKVRSPTRIGNARICSTDVKRPSTRNATRRLGVSKNAAGTSAFCWSSASLTAATGTPSVASLVFDSSTQIFSSCTPNSSIFPTSGTACSASCTRSA